MRLQALSNMLTTAQDDGIIGRARGLWTVDHGVSIIDYGLTNHRPNNYGLLTDFTNFKLQSFSDTNMKRRIALKQLGFITAGAMVLPSCVQQAKEATIALKNIIINGDQEVLLAEIAETIIPATDIPGAKALNVHHFILKMVDDCHDKESQQQFISGLSQIEKAVKEKFTKPFDECTSEERKQFLLELEQKNKDAKEGEKKEDLPAFYSLTKRYSTQAFLSSEYVMTNVFKYNMIPGRFEGCVEIKDKNDIQTVIG